IDPEILIIDEALSAGDLAFHEKAATRIQHIMKSAKATIVVTHNMNFVRDVCTRAIWIDNGKLMFDGLPEETIDNYLKKKIITTNQNKESS
ncbi:MAG: ABC transporter ATP-binding protein, partial [Bacilli bacterium]